MLKRIFTFFIPFFLLLSFHGFGQGLVINEAMSSNLTKLYDSFGETPDWIELYNNSSSDIQLGDYGLSDDKDLPFKWTFSPVTIPAHGYFLVYASGRDIKQKPLVWKTVADWGDEWKYYIPSSELPSDWRTTAFDDAAWSTGNSGFGFGDNDDASILPLNSISVFLRKHITVSDVQNFKEAYLHMDYDDGFVAYLNGYVIASANMGTIPPAFNALASDHEATMYSGGAPQAFLVDSVFKYLNEGDNILAIQVHNVSQTSSDLSAIPIFSFGMISDPENCNCVSPYVNIVSPGMHTNFKIDASGETIYLHDKNGSLLDSLRIDEIKPDISLGRKPDAGTTLKYFTDITPGASNITEGLDTASVKKPVFSHPGGVYSAAFSLSLSTPTGDNIYYTTDGAEPTASSSVYTSPIYISTDKVIRARVINNGELPGETETNTYIFGRKFDLPVISISTTPANLWDYYTGIYVEGPNADPNDPHYGANYWQDWEKPAHIEFFEPDGRQGFELDAGIKNFGGWSRAREQKSLAVHARNEYGTNKIEYDVFRSIPVNSFKALVFRNGANDFCIANLRDEFLTSLVAGLGVEHQANRPAAVYLNGEYWGLQHIREKVNEHFIASHFDVSTDSIDILETGGNIVYGDNSNYIALTDYLNNNNLAVQSKYEYVKTQVDVDNFINYQMAQIYFANYDWPGNNIKFWRKSSPDGKWRWIMYDVEFSFGLYGQYETRYDFNSINFALEPNGPGWPNPAWATLMLRKLMANQEFKYAFINRFADNLNTLFEPDYVLGYLERMQSKYEKEMPLHFQRWGYNADSWYENLEVLKTFALNRPEYVRDHIRGRFNISSMHNVTLDVSSVTEGKILLNSITPLNYPWTGEYFDNIPVTITAKPEPGYRFVRWEGFSTEQTNELTIPVRADLTLKAVFEPDGSGLNSVVINEVNYNSADSENSGDWIELYNAGEASKNVSYWQIKDSENDHIFLLPANTVIQPGGFLVVCRDSLQFESQFSIPNFIGNMDFGLSNTDCVRLFDYKGALADAVCYQSIFPWPESSNGNGHSLSLRNPVFDNVNPQNWHASVTSGTPGYKNEFASGTDEQFITVNITKEGLTGLYPNPVRSFTTLTFTLNKTQRAVFSVYTLNGRLVEVVEDREYTAGKHNLIWELNRNGNNIKDGIYIIKMETAASVSVIKATVINNR